MNRRLLSNCLLSLSIKGFSKVTIDNSDRFLSFDGCSPIIKWLKEVCSSGKSFKESMLSFTDYVIIDKKMSFDQRWSAPWWRWSRLAQHVHTLSLRTFKPTIRRTELQDIPVNFSTYVGPLLDQGLFLYLHIDQRCSEYRRMTMMMAVRD